MTDYVISGEDAERAARLMPRLMRLARKMRRLDKRQARINDRFDVLAEEHARIMAEVEKVPALVKLLHERRSRP